MSEHFVNPYTFIPVNDGKKRDYQGYWDAPLLSGKISCRLLTKTQISVCDFGKDERTHEFFSIDGKNPIIPGSSIRGVIRSIYEALTDSCLSSVNAEDDDYFSSRMNKNKTGLLVRENGEYVLYAAERSKDDDTEYEPWIPKDKRTGDKVRFDSYSKDSRRGGTIHYIDGVNNEDGNEFEGYVHRVDYLETSRKGQRLHNFCSIFRKLNKVAIIDPKYIERFAVNIKRYEPKTLPERAEEYQKAFDRMCANDGVYLPCWYIQENGHFYFAPSQMSRSIYANKPIDLLKLQNLDKCSLRSNICEACSLFGMVSDSGENVAGRVRFGDAECVSPDPLDGIFRLPILAQPRLSSFEFYLTNPNDSYGADDRQTRISGRKYYWHNNKANITKDSENKAGNNMDASVRLVKKGKEFCFEVFFDRITEQMLKRLLFALTLGENEIDGTKCHKLGHGKPVGLGSVKIVAERVLVRSFANGVYSETDRTDLVSEGLREAFSSQRNVDSILKVTDFNAIRDGSMISYPTTCASTDIFKWFAENRGAFSNGKPSYKQKLPRLGADPGLLKNSAKNNGTNRR